MFLTGLHELHTEQLQELESWTFRLYVVDVHTKLHLIENPTKPTCSAPIELSPAIR